MKKHINPFNLLTAAVLLLAPVVSMASGDPLAERKKNINKSYRVAPGDKLSIENSFGDVKISTWDKQEIQVNVDIGTTASTDEKAQQMMDQITVTENQSGSTIRYKTDIGNMGNGKKNKDNGKKFFVDYTVMMPAVNGLEVENSFGKINVVDMSGPVNLVSKFGELTTGNLGNAKEVHVEFGKADLGSLSNADVTFKFNNSSLIRNLTGSVKVRTEFCNNVEIAVDANIKDMSLTESYSDVRMNVPDNLSARFEVHTNFGSFRNSSGISISEEGDEDSNGPKFDKDFSGTAGSGDAKIRIRSSFGKVRLSRAGDKATDVDGSKDDDKIRDRKDKHKEKNKHKEKDGDDDDDDNDNDSGTEM